MTLSAAVAEIFASRGDSVSLASLHTLKPLDTDGIAPALRSHKQVVVIEEMAPFGGLGPRVKEIAWDRGATAGVDSSSLRDQFIHN